MIQVNSLRSSGAIADVPAATSANVAEVASRTGVVAPVQRDAARSGAGVVAPSAVLGGVLALLAFVAVRMLPPSVGWHMLLAFVGSGALLFLGVAAMSARLGVIAFNVTAAAGIFSWAVAGPQAGWAVALGLVAHACAWGFNAWSTRGDSGAETKLAPGMGTASLMLAILTLAVGL